MKTVSFIDNWLLIGGTGVLVGVVVLTGVAFLEGVLVFSTDVLIDGEPLNEGVGEGV